MRHDRIARMALAAGLLLAVARPGAAGAADDGGESPPESSAAIARGQEILRPFKSGLQQALREGLAQGPLEAIAACRVEAPRIADQRAGDGIEVGRTSHRLRNPGNAPRYWVAPLLDAFVRGKETPEPRAVALPGGRIGYVEPIRVQALCLTCHGETIAPQVSERIQALYPEDQAVGFAEGDLRGLFWAEFPAP